MSITAAERNRADAYAGPGKKEPLYSSGEHLKAAWNLAGRVKGGNAKAIRAKILRFAKEHGLMNRLPKTATKATRSTARQLLDMAYRHEDGEGDTYQQERLIRFAADHQMESALPSSAHARMHQASVPHHHGDGDMAHEHPVEDGPGTTGNGLPQATAKGPRMKKASGIEVSQSRAVGGRPQGSDTSVAGRQGYGLTMDYLDRASGAGRGQMGAADQPAGAGASAAAGHTPDQPNRRARTLVQQAYDSSVDEAARIQVIEFARANGLEQYLPAAARIIMDNDQLWRLRDFSVNVPTVRKAYNPVGKSVTIEKAWGDDTDQCFIEGWVSTPDEDQEHDIVPPEAFTQGLDGYAKRRMPLSSEHSVKALPIGHGQRIALVKDGTIFKSAVHPTDTAPFEHFPNRGTGVYGRFVITNPDHARQVKAGNIGGFSWIGNLTEYEPLPSGGRKFVTIEPWLESTVAAYPINSEAVLLAAKAFAPAQEEISLDSVVEALLQQALVAAQHEEAPAQEPVDVAAIVASLQATIDGKVQEGVQKALAQSREGVGRVGSVVTAADERESDPAAYIIRKSNEAAEKGEDLAQADKELAWGITEHYLAQGLQG